MKDPSPKGQGEGSYVLRLRRYNVTVADYFPIFKYGLLWLGSWELREEGRQSWLHGSEAGRLTCCLPGFTTALQARLTQLPLFGKGQAEDTQVCREIQASDE